jgi:hypothetical protein
MSRVQASRNSKVPQRSKASGAGNKNGPAKHLNFDAKQSARQLDRVSRKFDAAVEKLRGNLEIVGECLYELLAAEAGRECRRRFITLAEAGVLHDMQTLAAALESIPPEALPPSLNGVERYAALAVSQLTRAFDVQPTHQPGEEITVGEDQQAAFDWSAYTRGDRTFPLQVTVLRSGWKCGSEVLVKPKLTRASSLRPPEELGRID